MRCLAIAIVLGVAGFGSSIASAGEPVDVGRRIEAAVQKKLAEANLRASAMADDAEFLRRVTLDITGRIPTYEQAVAFLDDPSPDKRARLVDELLAKPEFGLHFATIYRDLMIDRSSDMNQVRNIFSWDFVTWLAKGLNEDAGWDTLVAAMLNAEGEAKTNPSTAFLLSNRMNAFPRPENIVASSGKLFLGIQIGCAQCHDHPYIEEWKQDEFWGLAAFFSQLRDHNMDGNGGSQNPNLLETPITDPEKAKRYVGQLKRLALIPPEPGAKIAVPDGTRPGETLRTVNAKFLLGDMPETGAEPPYRPKFSAWLTSANNPYFARATANRFWAHFLGTGVVNPIDDMSPKNEPSHPEVLALLTQELIDAKFSLKHLVRCICNSPVYQRTSRPEAGNEGDQTLFSHQTLRLLSPDQMIDAMAIASGRNPATGKNREQQTAFFVTKEADAPATVFSHGIPQFLYQMNGNVSNSNPQYLGKVTAQKDPAAAIQIIYLSVLSRRPKPAELDKLVTFVKSTDNQAYRDLYWALINSAEFMFNH